MTKHMRNAIRVVENHGFTVDSMRDKNHFVIHARHRTAGRKVFVTGKTPGDVNALKAFTQDVRRSLAN